MELAFEEDSIVGLFACQILGTHVNDRWFPAGRMKRTYLRDDGTPFFYRTCRLADGHAAVLAQVHRRLKGR